MCSQEEQFFINGNLPDFHQVDIPDIWIGLSGILHTVCFDAHCETINVFLKIPFPLIFRFVMLPDKDQDGAFRWVDKTEITFSNFGPGWPTNTANVWDCGQIFTGRICTLKWQCHIFSVHADIARQIPVLFQEIMRANGKQPTASRAWVTFVRWQVDRTPNQLQLLVSQASCSCFTHCLTKAVLITITFLMLQIPTATLDICCTGTSAISLRPSRWKTGRMPRLTVTKSRLTWSASTHWKSWVSSLVSS